MTLNCLSSYKHSGCTCSICPSTSLLSLWRLDGEDTCGQTPRHHEQLLSNVEAISHLAKSLVIDEESSNSFDEDEEYPDRSEDGFPLCLSFFPASSSFSYTANAFQNATQWHSRERPTVCLRIPETWWKGFSRADFCISQRT